jgi:pimeloyl-ACP methyl ester carboxylesterase
LWIIRSAGEYIQYDGETLLWKPCGELNRTFECSTLAVPIDHFNTANARSKTFTLAPIRLRGRPNARTNLLLNPGGPGASGFDLIHERGEQLRTIVGDGFHLLSFDPRGVNNSSPAAICYPDQQTRRDLTLSVPWI